MKKSFKVEMVVTVESDELNLDELENDIKYQIDSLFNDYTYYDDLDNEVKLSHKYSHMDIKVTESK